MQSLGLLLHDVSRLLKAEFERRTRETGLTLNQWRVLATLSRKGGQTQAALAAAIEVSPMTVSDVIERLESQGLVQRAPDPLDSRAKRVTLTEAAVPVVARARDVANQVYASALSGLSEPERATMVHALTHIFDNLVAMAATEQDVD